MMVYKYIVNYKNYGVTVLNVPQIMGYRNAFKFLKGLEPGLILQTMEWGDICFIMLK